MRYRTERDSLGTVLVPSKALYGAQTQRARENFPVSGFRLPRGFIRAQGIVKLAAARANLSAGGLTPRMTKAIAEAAGEVVSGLHDDQFVVDVYQAGAGTSQNMNANEVIANRANEILGGRRGKYVPCHANDHVNMGQSTNDTIPTAIHIAAYEAVAHDLLPAVRGAERTLERKARTFMPVIKSGRTHLQDAVPIRLGQEFSGYASGLKRERRRVEEAMKTLLELPIGGNAVGTGINTRRRYRADVVKEITRISGIGFRSMTNPFEGIQNVVGGLELSASLRGLAVTVSRLANDLRLLSSGPRTGLAELQLPTVQPGSSIMPGKVNPVMAEMMNMVCFQVIGNDTVICQAAGAGQLELNVMMPVMAYNLLTSIQVLANGLKAFDEKCLRGLKADRKACARWMEQSLATVTALNPVIGYEQAAEISKIAYASGRTIKDVVVAGGILSDSEASRILDPEKMVGTRDAGHG